MCRKNESGHPLAARRSTVSLRAGLSLLISAFLLGCANLSDRPCDGATGWKDGQSDYRPSNSCLNDASYQDAYQIGATIAQYRARMSKLELDEERLREVGASERDVGNVVRERVSIQRELDALIGIATTRGWIGPHDAVDGG